MKTKNTMSLWDAKINSSKLEAIIIAIQSYLRKPKKNLTLHLKEKEKEQQNLKLVKGKRIIKIKVELN